MMKQIAKYAIKSITDSGAFLVLLVFDDDSARYVSMLKAPPPREFMGEWFPKARYAPWAPTHRHWGAMAGSEEVLSVYELMSYFVTYRAYSFKVDMIVGNNTRYHIETLASTTQMLERIMRHSESESKTRLGISVTDSEGREIVGIVCNYPARESELTEDE